MSTAKETKAIDEITAKSGLRVVHRDLTGYKISRSLGGLGDLDFITKEIYVNNLPTSIPIPFVYNLPAGAITPIVIDLDNDTIKIGPAIAVPIGTDLSVYQDNPSILFDVITSSLNTSQKDAAGWISNKLWFDNTYTSLVELTLQPDTDTGEPGGVTLDDINIIIKA